MRKIIIFCISLLGFLGIANAQSIVYTNINNGGNVYIKTANGSENGTAITTDPGNWPQFNHAGTKVYFEDDNDFTLHYKTGTGIGNGTPITTLLSTVQTFTISPDDSQVIYANASDNNYLYLKSATTLGDGVAINSQSSYAPIFSPDGLWIYYIGVNDELIYKKSASDSTNGTVISSDPADGMGLSPDGTKIVYANGNDSDRLYLKNSSDSLAGSAIGTDSAVASAYLTFISNTQFVYTNTSHGYFLYSRLITGGNGSAITSNVAENPNAGPPDSTPPSPGNGSMQGAVDGFGSGSIAAARATASGPLGTIVYVLLGVTLFLVVAAIIAYLIYRYRV